MRSTKHLLVLLILSLNAGFLVGCSETVNNHFMSYHEAKSSGAIDRGWIPKFIPKSSFNIKEHHRVDVPHIYVELEFDESEIIVFEESCELANENIYICSNSGFPVKVTVSNDSRAIIESLNNDI